MNKHGGFGLYVHWPYCLTKCPYCDFNSHVGTPEDADIWSAAYVSEIKRHRDLIGNRTLQSIYIGGGTPSLMSPSTVAEIINTAQQVWQFSNTIEITLEANPTSVEKEKLKAFRSCGVNRLSLGVQALNVDDLRLLGRTHSVKEACIAITHAQEVFDHTSFDLIYARQNQTIDAWQTELEFALTFKPEHLSLYQLTIEPGTAFYDRFHRGGLRGLPDEDVAADMFDLTQEVTAQVGLPAYEISNHAKYGAESVHNRIYWSGGEYVGIGPGAHGRIQCDGNRLTTETYLHPSQWLTQTQKGSGTSKTTVLAADDIVNEYLMMGLRQHKGVSLQWINDVCGATLDIPTYLFDIGVLEARDDRLRATQKGRRMLNRVVAEIMV
ncbi:MAG: radical SAM family heme chaperone HemW [Pseudomonadota bacterium]